MTPLEVLRAARAKLAQPGAWTTREVARDARGIGTSARCAEACSWCAMGAIMAVSDYDWPLEEEAYGALRVFAPGQSVANFNDAQSTVQPVLALFDQAIASLEAAK